MTVENLEINVKAKGVTAAANRLVNLAEAMERVEAAGKSVSGSTGTRAAKSVEKVGEAAKKANKPLSNFLSSLKRIAFYRIIRGVIKSITQAFTEGLEKAYLFSAAIQDTMGHRFAAAMDSLKSATNAMEGQLGSAFISLLTALEPILVRIVDLVTRAADAISQFFAAFSGTTYLKSSKTAASFADTMKKGAGSAKEWKNQLLGFDEINRLNEPSGGGGGSNPLDGYSLTDTPINEKLLYIANKVKEKLGLIKKIIVAIGLAIAAWKIGKLVSEISRISPFMSKILGIALAIAGAFILIVSACDAWSNGVDWTNLIGMIAGAAAMAVGLGLAFGTVGAAVGLLVGGIAMLVVGIRDWIKTGELSTETFWLLEAAIVAVGIGMALLIGWPALIVAAIAAAALAVYYYWEQICAFFKNIYDWIVKILEGIGLLEVSYGGSKWHQEGGFSGRGGKFAEGGFPETGQLFLAREDGAPELVGSMGGHTAVANNDQIVEGIRQGVYEAVSAANNNGGDVSVRVYLDSKEIRAGQQRLNRAWGV